MRIERIAVSNFRNLADIDLPLQPGTVIVGENRRGKSNLLQALRLVLDPSLPSLDRQLGPEDFWEGLSDGTATWDPMAAGEIIQVSVEFGGIGEHDVLAMAALGEALIEADPMRARLVYRFAPLDTGSHSEDRVRYAWSILGGVAEREIKGDARRFLRQVHLHALRDVESDITSWRRSPLRPLLRAAAGEIDEEKLDAVTQAIQCEQRSGETRADSSAGQGDHRSYGRAGGPSAGSGDHIGHRPHRAEAALALA
jgi:putative ATP-dependent endonuclease of OLD family